MQVHTCSVSQALSVGTKMSSCGTYALCRWNVWRSGRPFKSTCATDYLQSFWLILNASACKT